MTANSDVTKVALPSVINNLIDGKRTAPKSGVFIDNISPRDGSLLGQSACSSDSDVDEAVVSARHAFEDRRWSGKPAQERREVLLALAALVESHAEEFAFLEALDVGKPIRDAIDVDVPMAAAILRYNAEAIDKLSGHVFGHDCSSLSFQLLQPIGVVGAIVGWNFPLALAATKLAPALASGNCVVLKPSELSPLTASRLADLALEAGIPPGVCNLLIGDSGAGGALAYHGDVDLLTFTGSTAIGKRLLQASGSSNMKRLILECGGKAANLVFDDAPPLDAVADAIMERAFFNQGQVCTASSRVLVHRSVQDELLAHLVHRAGNIKLGDPLDRSTRFGAVVSGAHRDKVLSYLELGLSDGAKIAYRSTEAEPVKGGSYVAPAILTEAPVNSQIAREEIFGPVLVVMPFESDNEAVALANDTIYGLSAIAWTKNLGRAHRLSRDLSVGWLTINGSASPKGGPADGVISVSPQKQSGISSEGGVEGLHNYMRKTAVQLFV
jgi:acyl-CoA reductase-like NAD-dependent aldehyde dehydrogenase